MVDRVFLVFKLIVELVEVVFCRLKITMTALFSTVELAPPVEVFALVAAYNEDNDARKVNLGIGGSCSRVYSIVGLMVFSVQRTNKYTSQLVFSILTASKTRHQTSRSSFCNIKIGRVYTSGTRRLKLNISRR